VVERRIDVINKLGLHARAAAKLVHLASSFASRILLVTDDGEQIDAKSILGILLVAAGQGSSITLRCDGKDENEASAAIAGLFADRFGEGE
jgi:phosphocarrier protein HPr